MISESDIAEWIRRIGFVQGQIRIEPLGDATYQVLSGSLCTPLVIKIISHETGSSRPGLKEMLDECVN